MCFLLICSNKEAGDVVASLTFPLYNNRESMRLWPLLQILHWSYSFLFILASSYANIRAWPEKILSVQNRESSKSLPHLALHLDGNSSCATVSIDSKEDFACFAHNDSITAKDELHFVNFSQRSWAQLDLLRMHYAETIVYEESRWIGIEYNSKINHLRLIIKCDEHRVFLIEEIQTYGSINEQSLWLTEKEDFDWFSLRSCWTTL